MPTKQELLKEISELKRALADCQALAREHSEVAESLLTNQLTAFAKARAEEETKAEAKKENSMYTFPEAGPGKWRLGDIITAMHGAYWERERRDLRRYKPRVKMQNRRLVQHLWTYGQKITLGSSHTYAIFFDPEIVQRAVELLLERTGQAPIQPTVDQP